MEFNVKWILLVIVHTTFFQSSLGRQYGYGQGFMGTGSYGIGVTCDYDFDCMLQNTYCYRQETCQCKLGFQLSEDGSQCITMIGSICRSQFDCNSLPHSECKQDSCQCAQGYVANDKGTECLPQISQYRGSCLTDSQCTSVMGTGSYCSGRCECLQGNHFSQLETLCLENRGLYQSCRNNSQCYIGEEYTSTTECYRGQCKCRYGYYTTADNKCASSSSIIRGTSIILLLGLATKMLIH